MPQKENAPATKKDLLAFATKKELAAFESRVRADINRLDGDISGLKKDVSGLKKDVSGLKKDVSGLKHDVSGLKHDVAELKTDVAGLKKDVSRLDGTVKHISIELLKTQDDVRDIKTKMATKDDVSRILNAIDKFASEAEAYRNSDALRAHSIASHDTILADHESPFYKRGESA